MNVTIAICTRNPRPIFSWVLDAVLTEVASSTHTVEVLVVDNRSDLPVAEEFHRPNVRYLSEEAVGLSRARNRALDESTGAVLIFVDDDVIVPTGWLAAITEPIANGVADAVAGRLRLASRLERPWITATIGMAFAVSVYADAEFPPLVGANMALRRAALDGLRYDEHLGAGTQLGFGEDWLLWLQLRAAGARVVPVAPRAEAIHELDPRRLERRQVLGAAYRLGRSDAYVRYHALHTSARRPWRRIIWRLAIVAAANVRRGRTVITDDEYIAYNQLGFAVELRRLRGEERKYPRISLS